MKGLRNKQSDRRGEGGLVSQRIGQFEQSKQPHHTSHANADSGAVSPQPGHRRRRERGSSRSHQEENVPILDWPREADSPRHSETDSWRLWHDHDYHDEQENSFYGAIYGTDGSSSIGTDTTDVKINSFLDHIQRLEGQNELPVGANTGLSTTGRGSRNRIRRPSKKHNNDGKKSPMSLQPEEDELDALVLQSSSSSSNGASEWFQNLLEDASTNTGHTSGSGRSSQKSGRRVRWKEHNQEHQLPPSANSGKRKPRRSKRPTNSMVYRDDAVLRQRTPQGSALPSHPWERASEQLGNLLQDNNPDSVLQHPPTKQQFPHLSTKSSSAGSVPTEDWDFDQQIFPKLSSSSSTSEDFAEKEMLPTATVKSKVTVSNSKEAIEVKMLGSSNDSVGSRSSKRSKSSGVSNESLSSSLYQTPSVTERIREGASSPAITSKSSQDPPTINSSLQDQIREQTETRNTSKYLAEPIESTDHDEWFGMDRIVNFEPVPSASSQLDPDGILLDTNVSDESAIHNQVVRRQQEQQQQQQLHHTSTSRHEGVAADNSPKSTWIPVAPPVRVENHELTMSRDPSPERLLQELDKVSGTEFDDEERDDDSSVFSDILSVEHHPQKAPPPNNRDFHNNTKVEPLESLRNPQNQPKPQHLNFHGMTKKSVQPLTNSQAQHLQPGVGAAAGNPRNPQQELSRMAGSHQPDLGEDRGSGSIEELHSDVSLLDTVSSDSDSEGLFSQNSQSENAPGGFFPEQKFVRTRKTKPCPIPIAATSHSPAQAKADDNLRKTPVADNRTMDFRLPPPGTTKRSRRKGEHASTMSSERAPMTATGQEHVTRSPTPIMSPDLMNRNETKTNVNPAGDSRANTPFLSLHNTKPATYSNGMGAGQPQFRSFDEPQVRSFEDRLGAQMQKQPELPKQFQKRQSPPNKNVRQEIHPPFTSVRETVASSRTAAAHKKTRNDLRNSTSIAVGKEIDGHRPFTSVRGTVASPSLSYNHFQDSAADVSQCSSRESAKDPQIFRSPEKRRWTSPKRKQDAAASAEIEPSKLQKNAGHSRDYWKSITSLKTLGSFDSPSAINDPHRKARKSQEFVARDRGKQHEGMEGPLQSMEESLADWHEKHKAKEQRKESIALAGGHTEQSHPSHNLENEVGENSNIGQQQNNDNSGNFINVDAGLVDVDAGLDLNSPVARHSVRSVERSKVMPSGGDSSQPQVFGLWNASREQQYNEDGHATAATQEVHHSQQHQHIPNEPVRSEVGRRTRVVSPKQSHVRSPPRQYFPSPTLMSGDSEDSASTEDQTVSILDGGTTVGPPQACCAFTIGDFSWGLEWFKPSNH